MLRPRQRLRDPYRGAMGSSTSWRVVTLMTV
jgi:hypothetical protein